MDKATEKLLRRVGYFKIKAKNGKAPKNAFPNLRVESRHSLSNNVDSNGFRKEIFDYKWKRDRQEDSKTIEEIEKKSKRIAVAYNKGGYQYVTDGTDAKALGKK